MPDRSADDYAGQLVALLPGGPAWEGFRVATGRELLAALAEELARLDGRACDLLAEMVPATTSEMLAAREREAGLPDDCVDAAESFLQRRDRLVAKWASCGGQSPAFYVELAALFGFTVSIIERFPFRLGLTPLCATGVGSCPFWWTVVVEDIPVYPFQLGCSRLCDPLCVIDSDAIECIIRRAAPAHTVVTFSYP